MAIRRIRDTPDRLLHLVIIADQREKTGEFYWPFEKSGPGRLTALQGDLPLDVLRSS